MSKPLILISNDDGYQAPGVRALIDFVADFGEIYCVCPEEQHSGQSMALTVNSPLRIRQHDDYNGAKMFTVNGTPVDCVKLAYHHALPRKPDLVLAGINHGSNAAINVLYSGTMGAVSEGCAFGAPAIGFSLTDHALQADFQPSRPFIRHITKLVLEKGLPEGVCLNVNIPHNCCPTEMRVVRECKGNWTDEYQRYTDPTGKDFFWLTGKFENWEPENTDTDEWCLAHGIVSIVPTKLNRTAQAPDWLTDIKL